MRRIEDAVFSAAKDTPEKCAVLARGAAMTYRALVAAVEKRAAALVHVPQRVVPVVAEDSCAFVVEYLSVHVAGKVSLLVAPSDDRGAVLAAEYSHVLLPSDSADILRTSGTTGHPKGVVVGHGALVANASNLISAHRYVPSLTVIVPGMLDHLGSLSKVYTTLSAGGTVVLLPGMKDPNAFLNSVRTAGGTVAAFLVPASIRLLLFYTRGRLAALDPLFAFLETGADTLPLSVITRLRQLLPTTHLFNTYASTETGIVATHDYKVASAAEGCVGRPLKHCSVSLTSENRIAVAGETLALGYISGTTYTPLCAAPTTALTTADIASRDEQGRLVLLGRIDSAINVGGIKVLPTDVEAAANSIEGVLESVAHAQQHPLVGATITLLVVRTKGSTLTAHDIFCALQKRLPATHLPSTITFVETIAHTATGKIDRAFYLAAAR